MINLREVEQRCEIVKDRKSTTFGSHVIAAQHANDVLLESDLPEAVRLIREAREIIDCLSLFVPDMKNLSKVKEWLAEVKDE